MKLIPKVKKGKVKEEHHKTNPFSREFLLTLKHVKTLRKLHRFLREKKSYLLLACLWNDSQIVSFKQSFNVKKVFLKVSVSWTPVLDDFWKVSGNSLAFNLQQSSSQWNSFIISYTVLNSCIKKKNILESKRYI